MKYTIVTLSALVATTSAQQYPCKGNWVPANEIMSGVPCDVYPESSALTESQFQAICAVDSDAANAGNNMLKTCCENEDVYLCTDGTGNGGTEDSGNGGTEDSGNGGTEDSGNGGTEDSGNGGTEDSGNGGTEDDDDDDTFNYNPNPEDFSCEGGEGEKLLSVCTDPSKLLPGDDDYCKNVNDYVTTTCLSTDKYNLCMYDPMFRQCCSDGETVCKEYLNSDDDDDDDDDSSFPCEGGVGEKMPGMCAVGTTHKATTSCTLINEMVTSSCLNTEVVALCDSLSNSATTLEERNEILACCDGKIICTDEKFMKQYAPNYEYKGPGCPSGTLSLAFGALAAVGLSYVCNML